MKKIDDKNSSTIKLVLTSEELSSAVIDYVLKIKPEYKDRILGTSYKEGFECDGIKVALTRI